MADRKELARQYVARLSDGKIDEAVAMLAAGVVATSLTTPERKGRAAVEAAIRGVPAGTVALVLAEYGGISSVVGAALTWSEPVEEDGAVKVVGTGSPYGPVRIRLAFNAAGKINRIDTGLGR